MIPLRLLGLLLLAIPLSAMAGGTLKGLRVNEADRYTRVVLDLSSPVTHRLSLLENPHRVVLDFDALKLAPGFDPAVAKRPKRLRDIRLGTYAAGRRLVLDVAGPMAPRVFPLAPSASYGHRLVIDLYPAGASTPIPASSPSTLAAAVLPTTPARSATTRTTPSRQSLPPKRDVLVAVDPGHGGNDPGALGPGKIREKDVVLSISKRLVATLKAQPGFDAVLVRGSDYYVALRERVKLARAKRADLFVSIHADAFHNPKVSGASVYTLSESGASSEAARWLAAKENNSDLIGGVGKVTLKDKDDMLAGVLLDMATHANRSASRQAGAAVLSELGTFAELHKSRVEKANFMVLKAPDVPSILVETGYISNPAEARKLASESYQKKLAAAIARGITSYLQNEAPPGTLLASQEAPRRRSHTIRRGETLSGLAVRYGIAARRIKEANGLRGDAIRIGQTLIIPAG